MKRIVLTGGTGGGKTSIQTVIGEEFKGRVMVLPEVAHIILDNCFPQPGEDLSWSEEWHLLFEDVNFSYQKATEEACDLMLKGRGCPIIVCDRGIPDVAAHIPGGMKTFVQRYNMTQEEALSRYDAVIHLQSLAVLFPVKYKNPSRDPYFGSVEYARKIEQAILEVYAPHPKRYIIEGHAEMDIKISATLDIVRSLIQEWT